MKSITSLIGLLVLCGMAAEVRAGGPPPICMTVDKLVFEPNAETPTHIQIWGTFALFAKGAYGEPVRGYLYYAVSPGKEAASRKEWAKLKKLVADRHLVVYDMCSEPNVSDQLRKPTAKVQAPVAFPLVESGFANADPMCISHPSLKKLLKLAQDRPGTGITSSARKADPQGK
jgi:hypothetical protein